MSGAPLLVVAAEKVRGPAPLLRRGNLYRGIDGLDLLRGRDVLRRDFVHRRAVRMDVAMRLLPEARLVVENDVAHALFGQMPDPAELELGVHLHVRVVRIVVRDARAVEADAVARVGPEGIVSLLR